MVILIHYINYSEGESAGEAPEKAPSLANSSIIYNS
jgi:hypothetical protein